MKVWLSRSRPGADRQAEALRAVGHEVIVAPVIGIESLTGAPPAGPFAVVVFVSEHAVRLGLDTLGRQPWFATAERLAVGERTAAVLAAAGQHAGRPVRATSEGLLERPELANPDSVLIVGGEGGRALLEETLARRAGRVARFDCYRRHAETPGREVLACQAVIAASGEGLREVADFWLANGGDPAVPVLVPSARVAALGVALGLRNLHDCAGADSAAWLRCLAAVESAEDQ